jgi:putative copper resistance protein D
VWIGALVAFAVLSLKRSPSQDEVKVLHSALRRFSGVGSAAVAALALTGTANAWVLIGPASPDSWLGSRYVQLLAIKLVLFAAMLALAASNRFHLTQALAVAMSEPKGALQRLRKSLAAETALGLTVLALVAWLGTLEPLA